MTWTVTNTVKAMVGSHPVTGKELVGHVDNSSYPLIVFRLLGAKALGTSDDYRTAKMPPVNVGLLDGQLAWRQHDGGHTDGPNWKYFIAWADKNFHRAAGKAQ
ncbi:MAG TPA: hypothetical protein VNH83_31030 [Bryobacteraceae bacterium]|nr:hypothetical protein [Bryobacteraceae bacterium]